MTRLRTARIRVEGSPGQVAAVVDVTRQSAQLPRRGEPGRVAVYLDIR